MPTDRRGNVELRTNDDGTLDEVVIYDANGACLFHLEQMSDDCFWMRTSNSGPWDLVVNLFARKRKIQANVEWEKVK